MFILSYFKKKQNKVKQDTLESLDDDFIVISDNLNNTPDTSFSVPHKDYEDTKEEYVNNIVVNNSIKDIQCVTEENNFETSSSPWSQMRDEENQLIENIKDDRYKKLSLCNKIMNTLISISHNLNEIFGHTSSV